jgi:hypothetical protein
MTALKRERRLHHAGKIFLPRGLKIMFMPMWYGSRVLRIYKNSEGLTAVVFKSHTDKLHLAILDNDSNIIIDQPYATVNGLFRSMEEYSTSGPWSLVVSSSFSADSSR